MSSLFRTLKENGAIRWVALLCLALPMFASYFFDDIFSTISQEFEDPSMVALGWSMADYGFYRSAYSLLCIFGGLIVCGMLLDRWGVRVTGSVFVGLMVAGAAVITYAISGSFASSGLYGRLSAVFAKPSLSLAYAGCAMFGLGSEIAGVTVNRAIAKWFKGREIAFAMGLQLALARLGTAVALIVVPRIVDLDGYIPFSETSRPAAVGMVLLLAALVLWALFVAMDYGSDRKAASVGGRRQSGRSAGTVGEQGRGTLPLQGRNQGDNGPAFHTDIPAVRLFLLLCGIVQKIRDGHPDAPFRHRQQCGIGDGGHDTVLYSGVCSALRCRCGQGRARHQNHGCRFRDDTVCPPYRGICSWCPCFRLHSHRGIGTGLFACACRHVALDSQDNLRQQARNSIFPGLLGPEHRPFHSADSGRTHHRPCSFACVGGVFLHRPVGMCNSSGSPVEPFFGPSS